MCNPQRFVLTAAIFLLLSAWTHAGSAAAQGDEKEHRDQGYAFFAPGAWVNGKAHTETVHFGVGGEGLIYKGIGFGGEIGYFTPWRDFSLGLGTASVNGSYHFNRTHKMSPFITGGYSMAFREGFMNLFNLGGGMNYWFHDRLGLRLEFRDHFDRSSNHLLTVRIGLAFR